MLVTSLLGILFNVINLAVLKATNGHPHENVNIRAAIVHLLGDTIQAVGVLISAIVIYVRPEWRIADPLTTFIFAALVMTTTVPTFRHCMCILLEYAPMDFPTTELKN
jgi:cation diffusion facilitator family transporter